MVGVGVKGVGGVLGMCEGYQDSSCCCQRKLGGVEKRVKSVKLKSVRKSRGVEVWEYL